MSSTIRLVAIADTHLFVDDLAELPDGDVLIHAGDLGRAGTLDEMTEAIEWFASLPYRRKVFIAGNHDRAFQLTPDLARALVPDHVDYLEDSAVEIHGLTIWGSPWQPWYLDWAFNLQRGAEIAAKWALIPAQTDILVTHGPPEGYGDRVEIQGRQGCADLLDAVEAVRPKLHLFGHIHQDGGCWAKNGVIFANVTSWECEREATVFDIDLATRAVTPVQVPPRGT